MHRTEQLSGDCGIVENGGLWEGYAAMTAAAREVIASGSGKVCGVCVEDIRFGQVEEGCLSAVFKY